MISCDVEIPFFVKPMTPHISERIIQGILTPGRSLYKEAFNDQDPELKTIKVENVDESRF